MKPDRKGVAPFPSSDAAQVEGAMVIEAAAPAVARRKVQAGQKLLTHSRIERMAMPLGPLAM